MMKPNKHQAVSESRLTNIRLRIFILTITLISFCFLSAGTMQATPSPIQDFGRVSPQVTQALQDETRVPVIVSFIDPVPSSSQTRISRLQEVRSSVLAAVSADSFQLIQQYSHVPALAGLADTQAIAAFAANPNVAYIQIDERIQGHLGQSVPALEANFVHSTYNITGEGVRVAVLDTGIDTNHPDLISSLVAQRCFTQGAVYGDSVGTCPPGNTLQGASAEDENGHGTNVSGIITSDGVVGPVGFAPDAEIVAVRVLDSNSSGWVSDWIAGMNWIVANQSTLRVDVINMSLGTFSLFSGNCDSQQPATASAIMQVRNLGITVFAISGNQGSSNSLASPACNSGVIAVGATYDSNLGVEPDSGTYNALFGGTWPACADASTNLQVITCFTNSNSNLDIVAPGSRITSAYIGGGLAFYRGTSQASPTAAGIAALLLQVVPHLTPNEIESILESTGTLVTDPKNGLPFPLINARTAIESLDPQTPTLLTPGSATTSLRPTFTWSPSALAIEYEMQLDQNPTPSTTVFTGSATSYHPPTPLLRGTTYYWRVRAINGVEVSEWSTPGEFFTESAANIAPLRNYYQASTPTLTWLHITWAVRYQLRVANNSAFSGATIYDGDDTLAFTFPTPLVNNTYYWQVRGCSSPTSCGAWSAAQSFIVEVP
jgi:subtilisin family serine protease